MSYSIKIEKVTRELVKQNQYVGKGEEGANDAGYRNWEKEEDVSRTIYTQIVSDDMDLQDVIKAVNGQLK